MNLRTAPATIALGSLALLLLAALAWVGLIGPALDDVSAADESRTSLQDRNQTVRTQLTRLRRQAAELPAVEARATRLEAMFPVTAAQPALFADIADVARRAGLRPEQVLALSAAAPTVLGPEQATPQAAAPDAAPQGAGAATDVSAGTDVGSQVIQLGFEGDYDQLTAVLRGLETMPRAFLVQTVTVSTTEDTLELDVEGLSFIMPPLGRPGT